MLRGLAAIGWNANGHADWLFLLVKWSGICQTGGDQCACNCSLVVTHAFTLEGFIWENSVFILRCVKFVHQNPRESITTDSQSISGCLKWMYHSGFLSFLSGGSGDSECGASEFTLMLVWYQFVHLETAGAFLFLEYVGMKLCWPEEKKQKKQSFMWSFLIWVTADVFLLISLICRLPKSHACLTKSFKIRNKSKCSDGAF